MAFHWISDFGFPGPDRSEGGRFLLLPPGYDGDLPDSGFHVGRSGTLRALMLGRSFMQDDDPKPTVDLIKERLKIYPYALGAFGTSIATLLEGRVHAGKPAPIPETVFVEASGKSFNTIPFTDARFFDQVDAFVQEEVLVAVDPEVMGQFAAIGIVKGKPFEPDVRMRGILDDAAAIGTAMSRTVMFDSKGMEYYPDSAWTNMLFGGGYNFETPLYDNQTRSMLQTPQRFPRAGSQSYPTPAAQPQADGSTTVHLAPAQPDGVPDGNWIQTDPVKGFFVILRLYSPLEGFFDKSWQIGEVERVHA